MNNLIKEFAQDPLVVLQVRCEVIIKGTTNKVNETMQRGVVNGSPIDWAYTNFSSECYT